MILYFMILSSSSSGAAEQQVKHQITGLFSADREQDLRETFEKIPQIKLVSIDFKNAEAIFEYDATKVFPGAKPDQVVQRLDALLRGASHSTFGVKPLRTMRMEKLKMIEIPVAGLDCKGCCLGAYEAIYKIDGVERATASFKERKVTALVDPTKVDRAKLEEALRKRGVQLTLP
jgi:copper chaperone CopZ